MGPGSSGSARPASFFSSLTDGLTFHPHSRPSSVLSLSLVPNLRTFELAAIILETFSHPPPPARFPQSTSSEQPCRPCEPEYPPLYLLLLSVFVSLAWEDGQLV